MLRLNRRRGHGLWRLGNADWVFCAHAVSDKTAANAMTMIRHVAELERGKSISILLA